MKHIIIIILHQRWSPHDKAFSILLHPLFLYLCPLFPYSILFISITWMVSSLLNGCLITIFTSCSLLLHPQCHQVYFHTVCICIPWLCPGLEALISKLKHIFGFRFKDWAICILLLTFTVWEYEILSPITRKLGLIV
jgi:hypothetical protein